MKKCITAVCCLFAGLALCGTGFGKASGASMPVAGVTRFNLPEGLYPFPITCVMPYTNRLPYIVQVSGDYGSEQMLLNVSPIDMAVCAIGESLHANTSAIVLEANSGKELARLQPPPSILDGVTDTEYIQTYVRAATPDLSVAVGSAGGSYQDSRPLLWERQKDGNYKASLLPLPDGFTRSFQVVPTMISRDGLSINGDLYPNINDGTLEPSNQVRWCRSSTNDPFQAYWGFQLESHYSGSVYRQIDESAKGDIVIVNEYGNLEGEDTETASCHIIQYAQGGAKGREAIVLARKKGFGVSVSPDGDFVLMRNSSGLIAHSMDRLNGFDDNTLLYASMSAPVNSEGMLINLLPYPAPAVSRPIIEHFQPFNATLKGSIYLRSAEGTVGTVGTNPITKRVDALDYFRNHCQLSGLENWNDYDYHLPYFVKRTGDLDSYYLVYLSKIGAEYYRVTVDPSKCH